jgi:hypothetical protein
MPAHKLTLNNLDLQNSMIKTLIPNLNLLPAKPHFNCFKF